MPDEGGNTAIRYFASGQVTAATARNGDDTRARQTKGMVAVVDITAIDATTDITVTIQGKDPVSEKYYTILASAVLAAIATTVLRVYPGLTAIANLTATDVIPTVWRIRVTGNGTNITYSIGVHLIE